MYSQRQMRLIESHWERIAARTLAEIRKDPKLPHMRRLSEAELCDWAHDVLTRLPGWPDVFDEVELARRYETLGRQRLRQAVPIHEAIRSLHHLKCALIAFVRDEGLPQNAMEIYAQEEFEHRTNMFFDNLMYYVARGYEEARQNAHVAA